MKGYYRARVNRNGLVNDKNIGCSNNNTDADAFTPTADNVNNDGLSQDDTLEKEFTEVNRRKKGNKRNITVIGDSIIKHVETHKMQQCLKTNNKIYVKCFRGAVTEEFYDYVRPSQKYSPELYVMHIGSNDLRSSKTPDQISEEVITFAKSIKTDTNDVVISSITARNDHLHDKGVDVNKLLKTKCDQNNFAFVNNSNIKKKHLNGSGVHLNYSGTVLLADNILKFINV